MAHRLDARSITLYHEAFLQAAEHACGAPEGGDEAWRAIAANHRFNCLLWREEDKARRIDFPAGKRRIDAYNQQRNGPICPAASTTCYARRARAAPTLKPAASSRCTTTVPPD